MMQVGSNQSAAYHSQPALSTSSGQAGRSSSSTRQQPNQAQYDAEQMSNIRPRLCVLRKWPHYDGYGLHLARNQHWLGLRIGDVEPNSPAESGGLLREDVVLAVNGHSVENDDFFVILSLIQHELEGDSIRFLVLDPHTAELARRNNLSIDENYRSCVRMETPTLTVSPEKLLYDQWRATNTADPTAAQNTINLGPTLPANQSQPHPYPQEQDRSPHDGLEDVYTFLPYSDRAVENGKSFFDILFEQSQQPATGQPRQPAQHTTDQPHTADFTGDTEEARSKHRGSHIKDEIKHLAKSGIENIKSILPTRSHDEKDKADKNESRRKSSSGTSADQHAATDAAQQDKQPYPYERLWQTTSPSQSVEDANSDLGPGARMCSVTLRPGVDSIGISLQPDKDFGHIIQRVEPDSPADYAGIQRNDCIISLNDIPLLNAPYQDVLGTLKRYRNEPNLDFLVAQKSYLLRSNQNNSAGEVLPSSNITDKSTAPTVPPGKALEQLFNKYNNDENASFDDVTGRKRPGETVSTSNANDRYDRLSPQLDNNRYPSKSQQGQIMQGVGPATADRSSWGGSGGKSGDESQLPASGDSSIRSASGDRGRSSNDANDRSSALGDSFKPLQVGITNPAASQQPGGTTSNVNDDRQGGSRPGSSYDQQGGSRPGFADDRQDGSRAGLSNDQRDNGSKVSPGSSTGAVNNAGDARNNGTIQNLQTAVPITPAKTDYDRGSTQGSSSTPSDVRLGPTKPTPAPSKPPTAPSAGYTDTDDEDLSDISEKPDEEDVSDPLSVSTAHPTGANAFGRPAGGLDSTNAASDPANRNANAPKDLNDREAANAGRQTAGVPSSARTIVQARRLERSDSDDTMSESDRSSLPSLTPAGTTVQARRLEKTDSDDPRPAPSKPSTVQSILQARRLEQADSDDIPSANRTTVQARRLEQADSDNIPSASSKPSTVQTILQARRLEQADSDDIQPANRPTVQARRLDKADSDENLSAAESQTTKRSGADSFYSPLDSADDGTDTDERAADAGKSSRAPNDIDKAANQKLNELLAKSTSHQQQLRPRGADDAEEPESDEESTEESSSDEGSIESQRTPDVREKTMLARMPLSELRHHGYEMHDIQLMQPTETSPVGLKLTKQQDPLQYVITAVAKDTKADLAGLKVDDWLVKIEDRDVRLVDFSEVSHEIRQLLTNAGLINMVVARKRSASPSPIPTRGGQQRAPAPSSSSRADSIGRQQAAQLPKSLLTTDITRDTPDNTQVRFTPEQSQAASTMRSQRSPPSVREGLAQVPLAPLSVGITNPISDDNATKSPASRSRSSSRSPTREFTVSRQEKASISDQLSDNFNPRDIREIVLQEASGLDFNSFIPEGDSQIQTHFISNVQPTSTAGKAGLRDGDRILTVNGVDVRDAVHEDVRLMMQSKKPLRLTVVNDPKYVELIENVKRNQPNAEERASPPRASARADSGATAPVPRATSSSPKPAKDDLWKYLVDLFRDDKGIVQVKHCVLKKDPSYNGYGLLLRYQNGLHLIDQVEPGSPAYNAGLREDDVILFVDQKNVEQMTHDDVKILIRKLALSNVDIDLVLIRKGDIQRYKTYQEKKTIDWKHVLESKAVGATEQTDQQALGSTLSIDDPISISRPTPRHSSASDKAPAPAPPTSLPAGTRVCILRPSPARTAGFALSGKSPPPFVICQIEKDSPADQAGLTVNDTLLAINGKSVTETTYEETVKLIKEALQQKSVELTVRDQAAGQGRAKTNSQSSANEQRNTSMVSGGSSISGANGGQEGAELHMRADNPVQEYQKQRNKELSYTLRLCHLHAANGDGTQAATFGFELSEEPDYEYPLILRVEPHSPAEGAGLQSRDILLKINEKKTKGLGYEKVKKEIEKAKRDGRLEMLVVDQETYDYCKRTKKPLKEPDMKVKHVFPKSRSSASFHKLPIANAILSSRESSEQLPLSTTRSDESAFAQPSMPATFGLPISEQTDSENEDEPPSTVAKQAPRASAPTAPVNFDLAPPRTPTIAATRAHDSPLKFFDPAQNPPAQHASTSSLASQNALPTARSTSSLSQRPSKDSKGSKAKALPNAINSLFHRIGHSKSSKPEYDAPTRMTTSSKGRAPSPPTSRAGYSRSDNPYVSQSIETVTSNSTILPASTIQDTVRSTVSTGSFDYLRGPRRCVLRVDRNKGLGFVLSATGDYDHTITTVEEDSAAAIAGLQVNDEVLEVDGVDVRNVKYEQVVDMIVSAIRTKDTIEMRVVDGRARDVYPSSAEGERQIHTINVLNSNNNNNNNTVATSTHQSQRSTAVLGDDLSDINSSVSPFDSYNQQKIATSYPNLPGQLKHIDRFTSRALSGSVPALATGITASPGIIHHPKSISTSSERGSITKLSDISSQDAPVARLCRVRKFATSPFYGFFLCGDPKKLGRVFISDVTKHSPAAVCGLRDGDRIIEINGTPTHSLTYETILDKIKQHMARDDLELLVLDKKSVHWYRERNYPITSRTLPTIVHIEPIINDPSAEMQSSDVPSTHTKMVGFADRRVSKTGL